MLIRVLGSGAGGGFPQWNCRCPRCDGVRQGTLRASPRTQSSIAISVDHQNWLLINASPDLRQQLTASPAFWPASGLRHTPLAGVLLTDAQIDHVTGLLMLREGCPLPLYCTHSVEEDLSLALPLLPALTHWRGGFNVHHLPEDGITPFSIDALPGLSWRAIPLPSNAPPFSPRRDAPRPGDNIGLLITNQHSGKTLFYAPGLAHITAAVRQCLQQADCLMVDGTFWTNDEMARLGLGDKTALAMGHMPQSGADGMINALQGVVGRKILIHINNTNPILDEDSPERRELAMAGIEVAFDGMMVNLC